jgi:hypothetical protein
VLKGVRDRQCLPLTKSGKVRDKSLQAVESYVNLLRAMKDSAKEGASKLLVHSDYLADPGTEQAQVLALRTPEMKKKKGKK